MQTKKFNGGLKVFSTNVFPHVAQRKKIGLNKTDNSTSLLIPHYFTTDNANCLTARNIFVLQYNLHLTFYAFFFQITSFLKNYVLHASNTFVSFYFQ